jgi:arsenate reductase (thioredoxin)
MVAKVVLLLGSVVAAAPRQSERSRAIDAEVRTGGLDPGRVLAKNALAVMREIGIDISGDFPKPVDDSLIAWADTVIPVEATCAAELVDRFPDVGDKLYCLGRDVRDPVGQDRARYRATRDELSQLLAAFALTLPLPSVG